LVPDFIYRYADDEDEDMEPLYIYYYYNENIEEIFQKYLILLDIGSEKMSQ